MPRSRTYDRTHALSRAVGAFLASGYSATSMRGLVDSMGVAPKSLYADFGSKDELFLQVIDAYIAAQEAHYGVSLGSPPRGLERICAHFAGHELGPRFDGCLLVNSLAERASVPAAATSRIDAFFERVGALYEVNLVAAKQAGAISSDADTAGLAQALLIFDQGLAVAGKSQSQRRRLQGAIAALLSSLVRETRPGSDPPRVASAQ